MFLEIESITSLNLYINIIFTYYHKTCEFTYLVVSKGKPLMAKTKYVWIDGNNYRNEKKYKDILQINIYFKI